jgi:uncharacterized lipoprotein YajG
MRYVLSGLMVATWAVLVAGCAANGKVTVTPEQAAASVACIGQVQTVAATARAQVSSCEVLARSIIEQAHAGQ